MISCSTTAAISFRCYDALMPFAPYPTPTPAQQRALVAEPPADGPLEFVPAINGRTASLGDIALRISDEALDELHLAVTGAPRPR